MMSEDFFENRLIFLDNYSLKRSESILLLSLFYVLGCSIACKSMWCGVFGVEEEKKKDKVCVLCLSVSKNNEKLKDDSDF